MPVPQPQSTRVLPTGANDPAFPLDSTGVACILILTPDTQFIPVQETRLTISNEALLGVFQNLIAAPTAAAKELQRGHLSESKVEGWSLVFAAGFVQQAMALAEGWERVKAKGGGYRVKRQTKQVNAWAKGHAEAGLPDVRSKRCREVALTLVCMEREVARSFEDLVGSEESLEAILEGFRGLEDPRRKGEKVLSFNALRAACAPPKDPKRLALAAVKKAVEKALQEGATAAEIAKAAVVSSTD